MPRATVTLFSVPGCPHCQTARAFLAEQGVTYVERSVLGDDTALEDLVFLVGRADLPVLYVGYEAVVGFDRSIWLDVLAHGRTLDRGDPFALPATLGKDPTSL